jgi:CRISPR/Cas system CSM-associated protein Csm3 (group 7 of RAMP superfamily)
MMHDIKYTIQFLSDWHCGSGLSGGAETDADIIKDEYGIPYVPGKTIKGLLRYALDEILQVQPNKVNKTEVEVLFGEGGKLSGAAFFSNASLVEHGDVKDNQLAEHLFRNVASTQIDDNGVAVDKSLRVMEVCMPVTLSGIIQVPQEDIEQTITLLDMAMKWTRAIGVNRNRGLGRCIIQLAKNNNHDN